MAAIHQDAQDAARYRWLRDGNAYFPEESSIWGGPELDAAIDREMAESAVANKLTLNEEDL